MSLILKGNTATGFTSQPLQQESIVRIIIINKTGGPATVNLFIVSAGAHISICPQNMQLASGTGYEDENIKLQVQESIGMTCTAACDYYFDLESTTN